MKYLFVICFMSLMATSIQAQFRTDAKELTIIVTDGTSKGKNSDIIRRKEVPKSYDQVQRRPIFTDPIRSLGMTECIQAAAFLERPDFGLKGFMLVFCVNDAIGGQQATLTADDGRTYQGVYRLIRQKISSDEPTPAGMTNYKVEGTFFLLGIS